MRVFLTLVTSSLLSLSPFAQPQPEPSAEVALEEEVEAAQLDLVRYIQENAEAIDIIRSQRDATERSNSTQLERLSALESTVDAISSRQRAQENIARETERIRFTQTLAILTRLISDSEKARFVSDRERISAEFTDLTDLSRDPRLLALTQHEAGEERSVPALNQVASFLDNPVLGAVLGVARLFSATKEPANRVRELSGVLCTIDVATTAGLESRSTRILLSESSERFDAIAPQARTLLESQLRLVGYEPVLVNNGLIESYRRALERGENPTTAILAERLEPVDTRFVEAMQALSSQTVSLSERYNDALSTYGDYLRAYTFSVRTVAGRTCEGSVLIHGRRERVEESNPLLPFARMDRLAQLADESEDLEEEFERVFRPIDSALIDKLRTPRLLARQ